MSNKIYHGDCLEVVRTFDDDSIDLIYLDPPFKSGKNYNVIKKRNGSQSKNQIEAFKDTWIWDLTAEETYQEIIEDCPKKLADLMIAMEKFLGKNDMLAYLVMMAIRLDELKRVLKPTGSIYLHCDPTASHYLKLIMDAVFGHKQFRNEIVWHYRTGNVAKYQFQRKHDVILFYTKGKGKEWIFTPIEKKEYYVEVYGPGFKPSFKGRKHGIDDKGEYRITFVDDVWDISAIFTLSKEHLSYPTQKPETLLERIIKASSNEGDIVLDPFCGCGTTIAVAEKLNRKWIGIDITHLAIALTKCRIKDTFNELSRIF